MCLEKINFLSHKTVQIRILQLSQTAHDQPTAFKQVYNNNKVYLYCIFNIFSHQILVEETIWVHVLTLKQQATSCNFLRNDYTSFHHILKTKIIFALQDFGNNDYSLCKIKTKFISGSTFAIDIDFPINKQWNASQGLCMNYVWRSCQNPSFSTLENGFKSAALKMPMSLVTTLSKAFDSESWGAGGIYYCIDLVITMV